MDNMIIDNFYLEYVVLIAGQRENHCVFARYFNLSGNILTVNTASGKNLVIENVISLNIQDCKR
jgi:hypothetical protein